MRKAADVVATLFFFLVVFAYALSQLIGIIAAGIAILSSTIILHSIDFLLRLNKLYEMDQASLKLGEIVFMGVMLPIIIAIWLGDKILSPFVSANTRIAHIYALTDL